MERELLKFKDEILDDIRSKKELQNLDDGFVEKKLSAFFSDIHNHQYKEKILKKLSDSKSYKQFSKSKEHDFLIKNVRSELRKVYGAFILKDYEKKSAILKKLCNDLSENESENLHIELLKLHKSTNERLNHYSELYGAIFQNMVKDGQKDKYIIMDLACGLNPISNIFFREKIKKYYASDISTEDCKFLQAYFDKTSIPHEVFPMDLADEKNYERLSKIKCDVCFIFKTLDGLERVKRDITEHLLESINTRYFSITFPTLTLSGHREIKEHRRVWLEKLLNRLEWKWSKELIENELLYMIEKNN
jgi:16S rRNA (guanine(1405)-N(7))-methyltransferase